jgi:hypothetical protein
MIQDLNTIAYNIYQSLIPKWLYDYVQEHKEEIGKKLLNDGKYTIVGPKGERIKLKAKRKRRPRGGREV